MARTALLALPAEILLDIIARLGERDALRCSATCRRLRALCTDRILWRAAFERRWAPQRVPPPDYRVAFVRLARAEGFTYRSFDGVSRHAITSLALLDLGVGDADTGRWAAGDEAGVLRTGSLFSGCVHETLRTHCSGATATAFGADRSSWAAVSESGEAEFGTVSPQLVSRARGQLPAGTLDIALDSLAPHRIAAVGAGPALVVWDAEHGAQETIELPAALQPQLAVQLRGTQLFTGGAERGIRVWDTRSAQCVSELRGHTQDVTCLHLFDIGADAHRLMSGSVDRSVAEWDLRACRRAFAIESHARRVYCVLADARRRFSGSLDMTIKEGDRAQPQWRNLCAHKAPVRALALHERYLLSGDVAGHLRAWVLMYPLGG